MQIIIPILHFPIFDFRKGKENKVSKEKKYIYNESPTIKERKLKSNKPKRSASLPVSDETLLSGKKVDKAAGKLKTRPTATEKIIEQIVKEEIVIEEELPLQEIEEEVVEVGDHVEDSAIIEEEEADGETLDAVTSDANEIYEGYETVEVNENAEEEIEIYEPIKTPPVSQKVKSKVVTQAVKDIQENEVENVPEDSKSAGKSSKRERETLKKKTKKAKTQKNKRKTEL